MDFDGEEYWSQRVLKAYNFFKKNKLYYINLEEDIISHPINTLEEIWNFLYIKESDENDLSSFASFKSHLIAVDMNDCDGADYGESIDFSIDIDLAFRGYSGDFDDELTNIFSLYPHVTGLVWGAGFGNKKLRKLDVTITLKGLDIVSRYSSHDVFDNARDNPDILYKGVADLCKESTLIGAIASSIMLRRCLRRIERFSYNDGALRIREANYRNPLSRVTAPFRRSRVIRSLRREAAYWEMMELLYGITLYRELRSNSHAA